ncbi:MAG: LLM class flavin-dependent oxidoreductase, partial [Myxococcota bacterium]
ALMADAAKKTSMVIFWMGVDRKQMVRAAEIADAAGMDTLWIPEAWSYDQVPIITEILLKTKNLKVGTGIMNCFSRSPALVAMTAATLDEIGQGRFVLGLGTSGQKVVEGFHGIPFEKPLGRLREYVEIVNLLLAGERLATHQGSIYQNMRPFKLAFTPYRKKIPIYIASLAKKSVRMVGEIADGWIPTFWPKHMYKEGISWIEEGAAISGRDPKEVDVAPYITTVAMDDTEAAMAFAKGPLGFYIGGMGKFYSQMLTRAGFGEEVDRVKRLYDAGKKDEATHAVDDKLIEATAAVGPMEAVRAKLDGFRAAGVTNPIISYPTGADDKTVETYIQAIVA